MDRAERTPLALLQVVGWTILGAFYFSLDAAAQEVPIYGELIPRAIGWAAVGFGLSSILWRLMGHVDLDRDPVALAVGAMASSFLVGWSWFLAFTALDFELGLEGGFVPLDSRSLAQFLRESTLYVFAMLAWHGVALSQRQLSAARDDRERAIRAQGEAERARLDALRYQLNPHFLFNALNSAVAMIDEDPRRAQSMLTQLSKLLRKTLATTDRETSTMAEEMELVRQYIDIERVRFEEALDYGEEVDDATLDYAVPVLVMQPLVDNAVKHGMRTSGRPLRIRVRVDLDENAALRIRVENTGSLASDSEGTGVGIRNVRERLATSYDQRHQFSLEESDGWVRAHILIQEPEQTHAEAAQ